MSSNNKNAKMKMKNGKIKLQTCASECRLDRPLLYAIRAPKQHQYDDYRCTKQ